MVASLAANATHPTQLPFVIDVSCQRLEGPRAANISCGSVVSGSTVNGTDYLGSSSREVFYALHVPESQSYTLSTCNGTDVGFDTCVSLSPPLVHTLGQSVGSPLPSLHPFDHIILLAHP